MEHLRPGMSTELLDLTADDARPRHISTNPIMCQEKIIRRFAGAFVLVSLALGFWVNAGWYLFTAFVGANLLQSSFTSFCPLEKILTSAGFPGCVRGASA